MKRFENLDIIIPVSIDQDWPEIDEIVECIKYQYKNYGFSRFILCAPCGGWRGIGYPPKEFYKHIAQVYKEVSNRLLPYGISCGWWCTLTIKSGPHNDFQRIVKDTGETHQFGNCPLDPKFRQRFSEDVAFFAENAKPEFIIFEDDYSVNASAGGNGCFCPHHLKEFSRREGKEYTREQILNIISRDDEESIAFHKRWLALIRDSLVVFSKAIRAEVDKKSPEIPIGWMQAGSNDLDGNVTEAICRALAGSDHAPFTRLCGTSYGDIKMKNMPQIIYHSIYSRQHLPEDFVFFHESDTFPHNRFFWGGKQIMSMMAAEYSYGMDGSTFQAQQLLDDPNEESAYSKTVSEWLPRLNVISKAAKLCEAKGVELAYDPYYHKFFPDGGGQYWTLAVSQFGIPFTTKKSAVRCLDVTGVKASSDEELLEILSRGIFIDAEAAKMLNERGFGEYIGVEIGEDVAVTPLKWDLAAKEIICEPFSRLSDGKHMQSAHMLAPSNGKLLNMIVTDPSVEVISELYSYDKKLISPAMTRFVNKLGGRIVVLGITLKDNNSQSLLNYRRQRLMQHLITWCADEYAFVKDDAQIFTIMNEAKNPKESGFRGMLTLINLAVDSLDVVKLHLPPHWLNAEIEILDKDGMWKTAVVERTDDTVKIIHSLVALEPMALRLI